MRLIVHLGFHKTASTHLQHLFNLNAEAMAARGVWYQPQGDYPAHHPAAWALLSGDSAPMEAMIANARDAGCHTVILSSEDLEGAIFNPGVAALIEEAAAASNVTAIEWHAAIREPGAYFESLVAQLSHHVYADALSLFVQAMQKGMIFIPEPQPGKAATPYWFYCFDYLAFLSGFAAGGRRLFVHDYADRDPWPGWRLAERLGVRDALVKVPDAVGHNHRLPADAVEHFYRERVREAADGAVAWAQVREASEACLAASLAAAPALARAVGERYADSYAQAVRLFGPENEARRAA